jgi:hypothetical protein
LVCLWSADCICVVLLFLLKHSTISLDIGATLKARSKWSFAIAEDTQDNTTGMKGKKALPISVQEGMVQLLGYSSVVGGKAGKQWAALDSHLRYFPQ